MKTNLILGVLLFSVVSFAKPVPVLSCKSIDVTFRPAYTVTITPAVVGETSFLVRLHVVYGIAGHQVTFPSQTGKGELSKKEFSIELEEGGKITGNKLQNGVWHADLDLPGTKSEELSCSLLLPH